MRKYETTFAIHPDLLEEHAKAVVSAATGLIRESGGTVLELNDWGNKKLAYPVGKLFRGRYIHLVYTAGTDTVGELERNFRISDRVFKYLSVGLEGLPSETEATDAGGRKLGEFEDVEPNFGGGGLENLLRETVPLDDRDEEPEHVAVASGPAEDVAAIKTDAPAEKAPAAEGDAAPAEAEAEAAAPTPAEAKTDESPGDS